MKKNKIKKYYISIFILLISVFNYLNAAVFFDLKNEYKSSKEKIYLKDIITISDMSKLTEVELEVYNRELKDIFICYSPFKKDSKTINSNIIADKLKRLKITEFTPYQNRRITILNNYSYFEEIKQKEIIDTRINELFESLNRNEEDKENLTNYKYKIKNTVRTIKYPIREKVSIFLKKKDNRVRLSGNQLFTIEIRLNERLYKRIMINTFIKTYKKVLVTKSKLPMNLPLHKNNFIFKKKEITGMENEVLSSFDELSD